jgi:hypothetical protein
MRNQNESYYSVDRLVEFGVSMAVAQQMISGFQQAMTQATPSQPLQEQQSSNRVYYAVVEGEQHGPLSYHDIIRMVREHELNSGTLIWTPGQSSWLPASSFQEIMAIVAAAPPVVP